MFLCYTTIPIGQLAKPTFRPRYAHTPFVTEQSQGPMVTVAFRVKDRWTQSHLYYSLCRQTSCFISVSKQTCLGHHSDKPRWHWLTDTDFLQKRKSAAGWITGPFSEPLFFQIPDSPKGHFSNQFGVSLGLVLNFSDLCIFELWRVRALGFSSLWYMRVTTVPCMSMSRTEILGISEFEILCLKLLIVLKTINSLSMAKFYLKCNSESSCYCVSTYGCKCTKVAFYGMPVKVIRQ